MTKKKGLGRGLSALITSTPDKKINNNITVVKGTKKLSTAYPQEVNINKIIANPNNPRKNFNENLLNELAESIKAHGIIQPIIVNKSGEKYVIIAGERRYRASKIAKLKLIPVIIKEYEDKKVSELAMLENIQRNDLSILEEAKGYQHLISSYKYTHQELADTLGKNRSTISNYLRILNLMPEVLELLELEKISFAHAKILTTIKEPKAQVNLANKIVNDQINIRDLEAIVKRDIKLTEDKPNKKAKKKQNNSELNEIINQLRNIFGTKVSIKEKNTDSGKIELSYYSKEELNRIIDILI